MTKLGMVNTALCLGLNLAIPRLKQSKWGRYALALIVLNELRGLYVVYLTGEELWTTITLTFSQ